MARTLLCESARAMDEATMLAHDAIRSTTTSAPARAPVHEPTDAELVALAVRDCPRGRAAYGQLIARHMPSILRHLSGVLRNASDAQDATQETFTRAYLALRRCPPTRHVGAWLHTVATRVAYNHLRAESTRRRYHERAQLGTCDATGGERQQYVQRLLEPLHPAEREVLILRHVEEWSVEEIASHLGVSISAAKMRLLRARRSLLARHGELTAN